MPSKSDFIGVGYITKLPEGWFLEEDFREDQMVNVYMDDLPFGTVPCVRIAAFDIHESQTWYIPKDCIEMEGYWWNNGYRDGYLQGYGNPPATLNARQLNDYEEGYSQGVDDYVAEYSERYHSEDHTS